MQLLLARSGRAFAMPRDQSAILQLSLKAIAPCANRRPIM